MKKYLSFLIVFSIAVGIVDFSFSQEKKKKTIDESLRKGETRQTLDPFIFKDPMIRDAYKVAKEIPWVLDSIFCYCYCEESPVFRHKSLLSCYVDDHAAH